MHGHWSQLVLCKYHPVVRVLPGKCVICLLSVCLLFTSYRLKPAEAQPVSPKSNIYIGPSKSFNCWKVNLVTMLTLQYWIKNCPPSKMVDSYYVLSEKSTKSGLFVNIESVVCFIFQSINRFFLTKSNKKDQKGVARCNGYHICFPLRRSSFKSCWRKLFIHPCNVQMRTA